MLPTELIKPIEKLKAELRRYAKHPKASINIMQEKTDLINQFIQAGQQLQQATEQNSKAAQLYDDLASTIDNNFYKYKNLQEQAATYHTKADTLASNQTLQALGLPMLNTHLIKLCQLQGIFEQLKTIPLRTACIELLKLNINFTNADTHTPNLKFNSLKELYTFLENNNIEIL